MKGIVVSAVVYVAANAIGLLAAAVLLDDLSVNGTAFVTAVVLFTAVEVVARPLLTQIAVKHAGALVGGTALVATLIGLVVTTWLSDGLHIRGAMTWVMATVIVWAAALLAGFGLRALVVKRAASTATAR